MYRLFYASTTKWRDWGIIRHREDKLPICSSAVLNGLPLALGYLPFTSLRQSLYTTCGHTCPVLCTRSTQKFCGKKNNSMKRTNVVRADYDAFLLCVLQVTFGYAAVFETSKEAYLWPLIVLRHHCLASFAEAC